MGRLTRRDFVIRSGMAAGATMLAPRAFAQNGGTQGKFKVGAVLELSGLDATGGQICKRGYEMWAKTVNDAGGINIGGSSYEVELIVRDCRSQAELGARACEQLIQQDGVDAVLGAYTSGVQIAMNSIVAKYETPCIAGSAESPENWKPQPAYTYGIIPAVDLTANKAIAEIVKIANPEARTAAVVGADEPFSKDTAVGFRDGVEEVDLELAYYTLFPRDADLTPVGTRIAAASPDIVAVGGHDIMLVDMVRALKGAGFTPPALIQHYGITDPAFVDALQKDAEGVMGISVWLSSVPYEDDVFGSAQEYTSNYKDMFGAEPDYTAAGCSTAGTVLMKALQKLGEKPGLSQSAKRQLNEIIGETDLATFYGSVRFESSGDHFHNNTSLEPLLVQIQNGRIEAIGPSQSATAEAVYPLTPWAER